MSDIPDYVSRLRERVSQAAPALLSLSGADSARRPAPGRWSPREIVGHLIDSASNNHQRFVRAQLDDNLVFAGYAQDRWVEVQRYQEAPWVELVELWRSVQPASRPRHGCRPGRGPVAAAGPAQSPSRSALRSPKTRRRPWIT